MTAKKILNAFSSPIKGINFKDQGNAGFDNCRENIDSHIKTKVLFTKEIASGAVVLGDLNIQGSLSGGNIVGDNLGNHIATQTISGSNFVVRYGGNVGIGTTSPNAKTEIWGGNALVSNWQNFEVLTTDSAAIDKGGTIGLGGAYTGTTKTHFAGIAGRKQNGTAGNYGGYLALYSRAHGGNLSEAVRIDSLENVGIGTTTPTDRLTVSGAGMFRGHIKISGAYGLAFGNVTNNSTPNNSLFVSGANLHFKNSVGSVEKITSF